LKSFLNSLQDTIPFAEGSTDLGLLMRSKLLKSIATKGDLPPLPQTINRLREMIEDPDSGITEVAKVIQSDPILSGRLIQLANSVYFSGGAFQVTGLTRALSRLGLKMALDIAYSVEVPKLFSNNKAIDQDEFWKHSLGLAIASSGIAKLYGANRDEQSHAYLGGLMRNIGIIVFAHFVPDEYAGFLKKRLRKPFEQSEEEEFGIGSAELGSTFIQKWWPVSDEVVNYVRKRPKTLKPKIEHSASIASFFLMAEGIPNGLAIKQKKFPTSFMQSHFNISEEDCEDLRAEISTALRSMG
jgi:HD-like signal output (HDOD) protein